MVSPTSSNRHKNCLNTKNTTFYKLEKSLNQVGFKINEKIMDNNSASHIDNAEYIQDTSVTIVTDNDSLFNSKNKRRVKSALKSRHSKIKSSAGNHKIYDKEYNGDDNSDLS